jgi:hypothetical protein
MQHDMARGVVSANRRRRWSAVPTCALKPSGGVRAHLQVVSYRCHGLVGFLPPHQGLQHVVVHAHAPMHALCDTLISSLCSEHTTHRFVPLLTLHRTRAAMGKGGYKDDGVLSHLYKVHLVAGLGLASGIYVPHADARLASACSKNRVQKNAAFSAR